MAPKVDVRHLKPRGSWVYLLAALPLLVFALVGTEYGAGFKYLIPALLCVVQFLRPTKLGWLVIFVLYLAGTTDYVVALIKDLVRIAGGQQPSILLDSDDSVVFALLVIYLVAVCFGLFRVRLLFHTKNS
jgi:hypothetical protein